MQSSVSFLNFYLSTTGRSFRPVPGLCPGLGLADGISMLSLAAQLLKVVDAALFNAARTLHFAHSALLLRHVWGLFMRLQQWICLASSYTKQ